MAKQKSSTKRQLISLKTSIFQINIFGMNRDKAIDIVNELPKEFELKELLEKLVFVQKVEDGLTQLKEGKTVPHEKVKEIVKKW
jgi:hypothetical protein